MIETPSRLTSVERTLVEVYGMLRFMQLDGSISSDWKSQVEEKCEQIAAAVIDIMTERTSKE